jgi:amino acid adenylation domain-containing protein
MSAKQGSEQRYSRAICPNEWLRLCQNLRGVINEVQLCVEGDGDIDPAALAAAVEAASAACPGARVVRRGTRWVDSGITPVVKTVQADSFDRVHFDSPVLRRQLTGTRSTPTAEVVLVRGTPTTVIFRTCHCTMDGHGDMLWSREVFRALRGEPLEGATSPLCYSEVLPAIAARLGIELPPIAAPLSGHPFQSPLGNLPKGPRRTMWRRRAIDGIHAGVTAKIARQMVGSVEGGEGLINIPVDMRQYMPGLRTTAGMSSGINMAVHEDEDWTDLHARLLTSMSEHEYLSFRFDAAVPMMGVPLSVLTGMHRWTDDQARKNNDFVSERGLAGFTATVSHLGPVDLADFSCDEFQASTYYSLGGGWYAPEINIVEFAGRTEVTLAGRDGPGVVERAEALLDQIEEDLSPRAVRVWDGNQTCRPVPPDTLVGLFAAQARRTPAAAAVAGPAGLLTYAELAERAAAVTAALAARGVGRGDRVGLVAGRTPAAIAAILGILGAGAAYLPIDASYPDARITALLADAAVPVCLLEPPATEREILPPGCQPIALDTVPPVTSGTPWPVPGITPGDLAYVLYTSGSTGTPKGIEIEHASLVNYVHWATRECAVDTTTRMPLVPSISFDLSGAIYLPLLAGGAVMPVPDVNAATLREIIEDHGATHMAITPSHLELINQSGIRQSTLRVIITSGEALPRTTCLRAHDIFGSQCRILNQFGLTETTIVNTSHQFDPATDTGPNVPIGRPMDNNSLYVLDARGRHVPPGDPGELYIGGIQVARGYVGRPELSRQRFTRLADGTRVYRTYDIVRVLPTGVLTFLHRTDDQVKIAGHRVEPAEIAEALETHPHVTAAAVIPRTRPGRHDKELCGYVITDSDIAPDDLKSHLALRLPRYMIPAAILTVPEIPRNSNGKTDPSQLPNPFATRHQPLPEPTPTDDVTTAITGIWARTLQADPATLDEHADFHELGGNSLLLLTMIEEVTGTMPDAREHFMTNLASIIREPTLGQISRLAKQVTLPANSSSLPSAGGSVTARSRCWRTGISGWAAQIPAHGIARGSRTSGLA